MADSISEPQPNNVFDPEQLVTRRTFVRQSSVVLTLGLLGLFSAIDQTSTAKRKGFGTGSYGGLGRKSLAFRKSS